MTSKIKVDNINKVSDDSNIIKKCGTTTTIGSGASNPIVVDGSAVTIGRCGGTVALASGATQTGFGREGSVNWQTGSIKTSTFTAASGEGYFVDTSSGAVTANLPAGSAGAIVSFADYTRTFNTNSLTISPNGSEKIGGAVGSLELAVNGQAITLVYVDGTEGWINVQNAEDTEVGVPPFIAATGGTIVTCGNFKTHIFTGPGTFTVSSLAPGPSGNPNQLDYLVVAGGAGGGAEQGGGGGAGGFRMSNQHSLPAPTTSPLANPTGLTSTVASFPISIGAGGAGAPPAVPTPRSSNGNNSTFSTITSTAGGGSGGGNNCNSPLRPGNPGGSGGGAAWGDDAYNPPSGGTASGGTGNSPPTTPAQGTNGGASGIGCNAYGGGGGGAATAGGTPGPSTSAGGDGSFIADGFVGPTAPSYGTPGPVGSTRYFAGGGGGRPRGGPGEGGFGGGGGVTTKNATVNTGGGAGADYPGTGGTGGSGIIMIRYKFQ